MKTLFCFNQFALRLLFTAMFFLSFFAKFQAQPCNTPIASLSCDEVFVSCQPGDLDGYCTTLPDFPNPNGPNPICENGGAPNNVIWMTFVASDTHYNINFKPVNCTNVAGFTGMQAVIYHGDCDNLDPLVCHGTCANSAFDLNSNNYIPGDVYYLMLDGCNGSVCDITVDILEGNLNSYIPKLNEIKGPTQFCLGDTAHFSLDSISNDYECFWLLNGNPVGTYKPQIDILTDTIGNYLLCVEVAGGCISVNEHPKKCIQFKVNPTIATVADTVSVCNGKTYPFYGKNYKPGNYLIKYGSGVCDSSIQLTVLELPIVETNLGTVIKKCANSCFTIQDNAGNIASFCDEVLTTTTVKLIGQNGCDSLVKFQYKRYEVEKDTSICYGDTLKLGNQDISWIGTYLIDNKIKGDTCVLEKYNVSFKHQKDTLVHICNGDEIIIEGLHLINEGEYFIPLKKMPCDSLLHVLLKVHPNYAIDTSIFSSSFILFHGILIKNDTIFKDAYQSQFGCDSLVTTHINISKISDGGLDCESAFLFCNNDIFNGFQVKMDDISNPTGPTPLCAMNGGGVANNTSWFKFVANSTSMAIQVNPENCTIVGGGNQGIQLGIIEGSCALVSAKSIACTGSCVTTPYTLSSNEFIPGTDYYLWLDGCAGSVCDVTFKLLTGSIKSIGQLEPIIGSKLLCSKASYTYSVPKVAGASKYVWSLNGVVLNNGIDTSNQIKISFYLPGTYQLCVEVSNNCIDPSDFQKQCIEIKYENIYVINPDTVNVCANDTYEYNGNKYAPGQHQVVLKASSGCDSVVTLTILGTPISETMAGSFLQKCKDDCLVFYDNQGDTIKVCSVADTLQTVVLTKENGCDSLIHFTYQRYIESIDTTICFGDSILIDNKYVKTEGTYFQDFKTKGDTCVIEKISVKFANLKEDQIGICEGDIIFVLGKSYSKSGDYLIPFKSGMACDSVLNLHIYYNPTSKTSISVKLKKGEFYKTIKINKDTVIVFKLINQYGCDSILTVNVEVPTASYQVLVNAVVIKAIPNPAGSSISFTSSEPTDINSYQIFNYLGQVMKQTKAKTTMPISLNIEDLPAGYYWFRAQSKDGWLVTPFIKQ